MRLDGLSRCVGLGRHVEEHVDVRVEVEVGELERALQRDGEWCPLVLVGPRAVHARY